jgi:hypothetical protein
MSLCAAAERLAVAIKRALAVVLEDSGAVVIQLDQRTDDRVRIAVGAERREMARDAIAFRRQIRSVLISARGFAPSGQVCLRLGLADRNVSAK